MLKIAAGTGPHRRFVLLAAAAALVAGAVVVAVLLRPSAVAHVSVSDTSAAQAATNGNAGPPDPSGRPSPRPAVCRPDQLAASVDAAHTGGLAGTEKVVIDLRNVGASACWLDGFPTVAATLPAGKRVPLRFSPIPDTFARDVDGPGPVTTT